jgi:hypothetical protein
MMCDGGLGVSSDESLLYQVFLEFAQGLCEAPAAVAHAETGAGVLIDGRGQQQVGLLGVLTTISFVFGLMRLLSSSKSRVQPLSLSFRLHLETSQPLESATSYRD